LLMSAYLFVTSDLNCECNATYRFYDILKLFISDNFLLCSDVYRLVNEFTYCRDNGSCTSWVDHILCSKILMIVLLRLIYTITFRHLITDLYLLS